MKNDILRLRAEGKTYSQIVEILGCSRGTISFHCGKRMTNNQLETHRKKIEDNRICSCGERKSTTASTCNDCRRKREQSSWREMTLGEKTYDDHKYAKYAYVRYHARRLALSELPNECANCGYDTHVECCHKKAISDFSPETKLKKINELDNLILLCPNCHWEFDNNLLSF